MDRDYEAGFCAELLGGSQFSNVYSDSEFDRKSLDSASHLADRLQSKEDDRIEASSRLKNSVDLTHYTVQWSRLAATWCVI